MKIKIFFLTVLLVQSIFFNGSAQNKGSSNNTAMQNNKPSQQLNRLSKAKSPYLQQHADNPVDWYEWGQEALDKAKTENKPLLISIGYAACHWCHVMEHESFMDSTVAAIMNDKFVSIKIDREERPDIDQIYMDAVQLLTGQGGWPLNAFALPDGKPFYAGTYFPKAQWKQVLNQLADAYQNQHEKVVQQANQLTEGINAQEVMTAKGNSEVGFSKTDYENIFGNWLKMIDYKKGGYNRAPKFPLPIGWEFLLQHHYLTGNEEALKAVTVTLIEMAKGGIYDQIGGGFARYSTDADWFAPHFEKMLYDNAQLVSLYAHAYKVTKENAYAEVIRETLQFVSREMTDANGGFYASLNADSEGEEGKFYVWTQQEINNVLDAETANLISDYYNIKASGNWEDQKNIFYRKEDKSEFAKNKNLTNSEWGQILSDAKHKLLQARSKRERPSTDDKILTSWNALMLGGYIDAYLALGDEQYLQIALKNAHFLKNNMLQVNGRLWRNYKDGEAGIEAFLDDYAHLANAYIQLYQATFDIEWLEQAKRIADFAITHFRDKESGMFYYTSDEATSLIARKMEISDNVMPASNSVMAHVLYKLGEYYYHQAYIDMSKTMLNHVSNDISDGGPYYANWAMLMGLMTYKPYEIAIMGDDALEKNRDLQKAYLPTSFFMGGHEENLSLLEYKLIQDKTLIYVCRNKTCKLPVTQVEEALKQMN